MKKIMKLAPLLLFLIINCSCKKESKTADNQLPSFELKLLNSQGDTTTSFKEGEDIKFCFKLKDYNDSDYAWYDWCEAYGLADLYKVYVKSSLDVGESSYSYLGKPYSMPVNCEDKPVLITKNNHFYLITPWSSNAANKPLIKGKYKVEFSISLKVNGNILPAHQFIVYFTVNP